MISFTEALDIFKRLVANNNGQIIKLHHQFDFIDRINRVFTINLCFAKAHFSFFKPKVTPRGMCSAAVSEWYRYKMENRDFLDSLSQTDMEEGITNRINFLFNYERDSLKAMFDELQKTYSLSVKNIELAFIKQMDLSGLEKFYGLDCKTCYLQSNLQAITGLESSLSYSAKQHNEITTQHALTVNFSSTMYDFHKVIDAGLASVEIPELKQIHLLFTDENQRHTGHAIGLTAVKDDANEKKYFIYDPTFGEVAFASLNACKQFLYVYSEFFFRNLATTNLNLMKITTYANSISLKDENQFDRRRFNV